MKVNDIWVYMSNCVFFSTYISVNVEALWNQDLSFSSYTLLIPVYLSANDLETSLILAFFSKLKFLFLVKTDSVK